jgi:polyisoprenoid-binding protein YceI
MSLKKSAHSVTRNFLEISSDFFLQNHADIVAIMVFPRCLSGDRMNTITLTIIGLLIFPGLSRADLYSIDASHTHIGFSIKHLVISNVRGRFNHFAGTIEIDQANNIQHVSVEIKASSIDTEHKKRDKHLRGPDFLDVEKYPFIIFTYKRTLVRNRDNFKVVGDLNLHGVTREVILDMRLLGKVKDPWGNHRAGMTGRTEISRKDFGIVWNKLLDNGGVIVGDIITIFLEIEGILRK